MIPMNLYNNKSALVEALHESSEYLNSIKTQDLGVVSNISKDLKTIADTNVSLVIEKILSNTGILVLSEENIAKTPAIPDNLYWLIDPIDGTLNLSRGFNIGAINIALMQATKPIISGVYSIMDNKCYYSWEKSACVSDISRIDQAVIATGFPSGFNYNEKNIKKVCDLVSKFKKVRMLGSASAMILEVAKGVFDCYHENDIYLWDIAASIAILKANGGDFRMEQGSDCWKFKVICSNGKINIDSLDF